MTQGVSTATDGDACILDGCELPIKNKKRGYCNRHYLKFLRHGDPLAGGARYATPEEAFAARTEWQGGCLVWTGSKGKGYGQIAVGGKLESAHRYAYERAYGPVPEGLVLDHRCYNRACANVEHLRAITQRENCENRSGPASHNTSGYRNVFWSKQSQRWFSMVVSHGKEYRGPFVKDILVANESANALRSKYHISE